MTTLHVVLGTAVIVVNAAAGALGAWRWWRGASSRAFWPLLRAGQGLVVLQALDGGVLLALGEELPRLHLIYGLAPLGVSFLAEQLRLTSALAVLQARGVESARELPEAERRAAALDILRREMGVMAASALVVAALGLRAGGVL